MCGVKNGQALILVLVFLAIIAAGSSAILGQLGSVAGAEKREGQLRLATQIAQAGIDKAIFCFNQTNGANCGGVYGTNYTGESGVSVAPGIFTTTVTTVDATTKEIESTAYIPDATDPLYTRTLRGRATVSAAGASFNYGLQVGDDGLEMDNNAQVVGSVYSNGAIDGATGTTISGDAYAAGGANSLPDQEWTATNGDFNFGQGAPQTDVAQSFIPGASGDIIKISFYIKKFGLPPDATVRILQDNNGAPSKTVLESGTLRASDITIAYSWVDVSLDDPLSVAAGTRYWLSIDSANNTLNYRILGIDSPGGYANGKAMYSSSWNAGSPVWSDAGGDFNFKVWPGGDVRKITDMTIGGDAHANTIEDSTVTGDAFYQTVTNTVVLGTSNPGSPNPAPEDFPISDGLVEQWKQAAEAGGVIAGNYEPGGAASSLGPKKITGDLILDNGHILTLTGTIYVTGNVDIKNNASIVLDVGYGGSSGVIVADGWIHAQNNGIFQGAGPNSFVMVLSTAAGGGDHDSAIDLHNNAEGAIFYAKNGLINLHNNVAVEQLTGKKIHLSNGATLTYNSGLANVNFSSGPGGSWVFSPGSWRVIK